MGHWHQECKCAAEFFFSKCISPQKRSNNWICWGKSFAYSGGQLISGYTLLKCLPLIMSTRKKKHSELYMIMQKEDLTAHQALSIVFGTKVSGLLSSQLCLRAVIHAWGAHHCASGKAINSDSLTEQHAHLRLKSISSSSPGCFHGQTPVHSSLPETHKSS